MVSNQAGRLGEQLGIRIRLFFPDSMRDNARLWCNGIEELVGFAISENGNAEFYVPAKRAPIISAS